MGKDLYYIWLGNEEERRPRTDCEAALRAQLRSDSMNLDWITVGSFSLKKTGQKSKRARRVHQREWYKEYLVVLFKVILVVDFLL